jgi:hypothetical protein
MSDISCPYCDADLDICHDDGYGYEEGVKHHMECDHCGKSFVFETCISFDYYPEKADCLNGGDHDYSPSRTFPKEFTRMICKTCGDERQPTEEEWIEINRES